MCGLHGIITNKREINADDFIRDSFVANMLRGVDSSGIATVNTKTNQYDYQKLPVPGMYFVQNKAAIDCIKSASMEKTITMCHVRAATVGGVSLANAHPFVAELEKDRVVIGAHNGTLTGWSSQKHAKYYSVDSEWAINHIASDGYEAFEDFRGAYCFVWWDSDTKDVLNIARNSERPMYVAMLESGGMAYASEAGMLYWLLERNKVKMKGEILELQEGFWYKFNINDVEDFDKVKLPERIVNYSSSVNSNYVSNPARHEPASSMAKVRDLLSRVKKGETTDPVKSVVVPINGKHPNVSQVEYEAARSMNLLGTTATFVPFSEWSDGIEGLAYVLNSEVMATVRGYDTPFDNDEEWSCKIIGVQDDTAEMTLILGLPVMKDRKRAVH